MEIENARATLEELRGQVEELDNKTGLSPEQTAELEKRKKELADAEAALKVAETKEEKEVEENAGIVAAAAVTAATRVVEKIVDGAKQELPIKETSGEPLNANKPHMGKEDLENVVAGAAAQIINTQVPPDLELAGKTAVVLAAQQKELVNKVGKFTAVKTGYDNTKKTREGAEKAGANLENIAAHAPDRGDRS